jgi:ParB family chromosome partitioning protein
MMASAGCFVEVDDDGFLKVEFGHVKPKQKEAAAKVVKEERKEQAKAAAKTAKGRGKPAPESKHLSNALIQRLEAQMISATRDAIAAEPQLVNRRCSRCWPRRLRADHARSPIRCRMRPHQAADHPPGAEPGVFNAAIAKRFDAEITSATAPKGLSSRRSRKAINQDEARKVGRQEQGGHREIRAGQPRQDRLAAEGTAHRALQGAGQRGLQAAARHAPSRRRR